MLLAILLVLVGAAFLLAWQVNGRRNITWRNLGLIILGIGILIFGIGVLLYFTTS